MMLPILISVSLAPGSYFFCARTPLEVAASIPSAVETTASFFIVDISVSLPFHLLNPTVRPLERSSFDSVVISISPEASQQKAPAAKAAGAASLLGRRDGISRRRRRKEFRRSAPRSRP